MNVIETDLPGVLVIEARVHGDHRGYFLESYNEERFYEAGIRCRFVQDNLSYSARGILRGLHFQNPHGQAKLVQVLAGEVFDVAVDIRMGSATFGKWTGRILSSENKRQMLVPEGFAHGFCVLSPEALFSYKCSDFYAPECEGGILWNDPDIGITWPLTEPLLSLKDTALPRLRDIPREELPVHSNMTGRG